MGQIKRSFWGVGWFCWLLLLAGRLTAAPLELTNAVVVFPSGLSGPERKAVTMLVEEVEKRTRIRWPELNAWPATNELAVPVIAVGPKSQLDAFGGTYAGDLRSEERRVGKECRSRWSP